MLDVKLSGPVFQPNVSRVVSNAVDDAEHDVALAVQRDWQQQLYPGHGVETGAYRRSLHVVTRSMHSAVVDDGSVKGPWLEAGRSGTRFKGYAAARKATQRAQRKGTDIVDRAMKRLTKRLD